MRWTQAEYDAFIARREPSGAKPESVTGDGPLAEVSREEKMSLRPVVRIASFRRRVLDPDNLIGGCKYFIDGLRHAGLIPDDRPEDITLEVRQEKVTSKIEERTEIEIL